MNINKKSHKILLHTLLKTRVNEHIRVIENHPSGNTIPVSTNTSFVDHIINQGPSFHIERDLKIFHIWEKSIKLYLLEILEINAFVSN